MASGKGGKDEMVFMAIKTQLILLPQHLKHKGYGSGKK